MAAVQEIEQISHLMEQAKQEVSQTASSPVVVARMEGNLELRSQIERYQLRAIGVEGRRLIPYEKTQRIFALSDGVKITPLPYAEDVFSLNEPAKGAVIRTLAELGSRR